MRSSNVATPVSSSNGDDGKLGKDNGSSDGKSNFLTAFHTKTKVPVAIANNNKGLESGSLSSGRLLLDRHDLQHFILKIWEENVNNLVLLDGKRRQENFLDGIDLVVLHKSPKLSDRDPLFLLGALRRSRSTSSPAITSASSKSSTESSSLVTGLLISHCYEGQREGWGRLESDTEHT